jgi:2-hydroxychromene-2-carboxylate isomerase
MIEFFFDCSSPWTYLAFRNIQPLANQQGVTISWRPALVGGIFNTVNQRMYASREDADSPRNRYMIKDLQDCARQAGVHIEFPPKVFPVNSVKAMRGCLWLGQNSEHEAQLLPFIEATFAAYFTLQADISQDNVLAEICLKNGIGTDAFFAGIALLGIKAQLKTNTDEAIARGAFGVPTFFVGSDMYFGNDRLHLAITAAAKQPAVI